MELSTLDLWYLVREWQSLVGGRIQKIYLKDRVHVLQVYSGKLVQWVLMDGAAFISSAKMSFPQTPSGYCTFLRKRVQGFKISSIDLLGFDRIVKTTVETKEGPVEFIIELFQELNSMVVKEGKIVSALTSRNYAERSIRGGQPYLPPPSKLAPWNIPVHDLVGKHAGKTIAAELGLGGKYSEEVCARAGVNNKTIMSEADAQKIHETLVTIRDEPLSPIHNESEALPFPFRTKSGGWENSESFNEAIDLVTRLGLETHERKGEAAVHEKLLNKQQKIIAAQEASLQKLEQQAAEHQQAGEAIYAHYAELKELLAAIKNDWKQKTLKEVQERYGAHRFVKAINPDGTIDLELP